MIDESGGNHASYAMIDPTVTGGDYAQAGLRSENEDLTLKDKSLVAYEDEFRDGCHLQILTVFPALCSSRSRTRSPCQVLPKGQNSTALNWTYIGLCRRRTRAAPHAAAAGQPRRPAGYVSMEDGAVGGFVQRGIATAADERAVVEMGGGGTASEGTRATEASVRGFWKAYRAHMGI